MELDAKEALAIVRAIIGPMKNGKITYQQAKERSEPYLKIVNQRMSEIAKANGKSTSPVSFSKLAR